VIRLLCFGIHEVSKLFTKNFLNLFIVFWVVRAPGLVIYIYFSIGQFQYCRSSIFSRCYTVCSNVVWWCSTGCSNIGTGEQQQNGRLFLFIWIGARRSLQQEGYWHRAQCGNNYLHCVRHFKITIIICIIM